MDEKNYEKLNEKISHITIETFSRSAGVNLVHMSEIDNDWWKQFIDEDDVVSTSMTERVGDVSRRVEVVFNR